MTNDFASEKNNPEYKLCRELVKLRLGHRGDFGRPLSWRRISDKLKVKPETIKEARRSHYFFHHALDACNNIGISRIQAMAAKRNRSMEDLLTNAFKMDAYLIKELISTIDVNPLSFRTKDDHELTDGEIEYLVQEADKLVVVPNRQSSNNYDLVSTIALTRRHVKWLLNQGYEYQSDKILFKAAGMTRSVCSRTALLKKDNK